MTIKNSGSQLSFSEIEAEFGQPDNGRSLGRYRSSDSEFKNKSMGQLSNLPLDTGIPASGEIKFSQFYGKKLNLVVDYYNDTGTAGGEANNILNRQDNGANTLAATWRYNNQSDRVKVVGGYRDRPTGTVSGYTLSSSGWQGGKKILVHVNNSIGGVKAGSDSDRNKVALRTGNWPSGTSLQIDIGSSGRIQGAGGNGRQGQSNSGTPAQAFTGTSGLGIEYPAQINNSGIIRCGYGGEKISMSIDYAIKKKCHLIVISKSGGARMMESATSLMQMAKTSARLNDLSEAGLPYISLCTDPTTGGTTASFAMLGDINIAEPKALIAFAGPRVVKDTTGEDLPEGFQKSEFLLEKGFLDFITHRKDLKKKVNLYIDLIQNDSLRKYD